MDTKRDIEIFDTVESVSIAAAQFIIDKASRTIKSKGKFSISLSGGSTPSQLFSLLATEAYRDQIEWDKVFVFWGDERCVPLHDPRNNANVAKELLLSKVNIPAANIYRVPSDFAPARAAEIYEETLRYYCNGLPLCFDLILLGLGENGHTASLFPHTPVLQEKTRWIKEVYVDEQKEFRITMTAPLINMAHQVLFLVTGNSKSEVVNTILNGEYNPDKYPAQLINPQIGNLHWYLDKAAAAQLEKYL